MVDQYLDAFLARYGWQDAVRQPLAGDASFRHYIRLMQANGNTALCMVSPPDKESIDSFLKVAKYLHNNHFRAPEIYHIDKTYGLILLEDFGNHLYRILLEDTPDMELSLYEDATTLLTQLHQTSLCQDIVRYDSGLLIDELRLFDQWYLPYIGITPDLAWQQNFMAVWHRLLDQLHHLPLADVTVLRDYHADNLMRLPGGTLKERVGLLDFQDAVVGNPAYDLVSLLEDARRDVSVALQGKMVALYASLMPKIDKEALLLSYAILGLQRNLKILGIFARLYMRDHKPIYLKLLPRVIGYIEQNLTHEAVQDVATIMPKGWNQLVEVH